MATWTRAYDEDGNLIKIEDASKDRSYKCPTCGVEMRVKRGQIRQQHFYHFPEIPVTCSDESFFHFMGKTLFQERFSKKDSLTFKYNKIIRCNKDCIKKSDKCQMNTIEELSVHDVYDKCELECTIGKFRADILLTKSGDDSVEPLLIEIWHSHKSDYSKINSGYKIIEIKITSEEDFEILNQPIIEESDKVKFYGFEDEGDLSKTCGKFEGKRLDSASSKTKTPNFTQDLQTAKDSSIIRAERISRLKQGRHCYTCRYSYGWAEENNVRCYYNQESFSLGLLPQNAAVNCSNYEYSDKLIE